MHSDVSLSLSAQLQEFLRNGNVLCSDLEFSVLLCVLRILERVDVPEFVIESFPGQHAHVLLLVQQTHPLLLLRLLRPHRVVLVFLLLLRHHHSLAVFLRPCLPPPSGHVLLHHLPQFRTQLVFHRIQRFRYVHFAQVLAYALALRTFRDIRLLRVVRLAKHTVLQSGGVGCIRVLLHFELYFVTMQRIDITPFLLFSLLLF